MSIMFDEGPRIREPLDPLSRRDLEVVVALGTDLEIAFDDPPVDDLVTGFAFHPEVIGKLDLLALLFPLFYFFFAFLEPGHFFKCFLSLS
jgi:hypothetical protein